MTIICPLCCEQIGTYHGQYTDGTTDGSVHMEHHKAPVYIKGKLNTPRYKIICPASGEPLLSPEDD
jgi:hypothetical protein